MSTTARLILVLALITLSSRAFGHEIITRMSDRRIVSYSELVADAQSSDLVLIGESHDNRSHHELQLTLIRSLYAVKLPMAIGLEMMETQSQPQLDDWVAGRMDESTFRMVFAANWSLDWNMYREIFIFARDNRIPMLALNVPNQIVKKVAHEGFASLTPEERKGLPQGTSCDLHNPHTEFLKKAFQGMFTHSGGNKTFTHFCEAQTLRNSAMALNIVRYHERHRHTKVVVLTGIWHAIKNAIPEHLARNGGKATSTVIVPEVPELASGSVAASEADYMVDL